MKHLVLAVSPESSVSLLQKHADIILLDQGLIPNINQSYDTVYIRSHFSTPELQPQNFNSEIISLVSQARNMNSNVKIIDKMDNVEKIINFEDKWEQYQIFSKFMPRTELFNERDDPDGPEKIYKMRLSSRGAGVTKSLENVIGSANEWITQELLDISEELRIYIVRGKVYPIGAIRTSMTTSQKTRATRVRELTPDESSFALNISQLAKSLDFIGLDIARTSLGDLKLMEVNRSPGFGAFAELTGVNLADLLYDDDL